MLESVLGKTLDDLEGKVEKGAKAISLIKVSVLYRRIGHR